jgi:phenylalanyl-tRNA synthetase beta chain
VEFREKIKRAFVNTGFSEVLSYSFGDFSEGAVELMNPISKEKAYMRTDLVRGLNEVVEKNRRSFDDIKIFEFGKVFDGVGKEHWSVAAAVRIKGDDQSLRMLRGATEAVLKNIGITEFELIPEGNKSLILKIGGRRVGTMFLEKSGISFFEANAEILLDESQGEFEYKPVSPYPSVQRDVSFWAKNDVTVGGLLEAINISNIPNLEDVDLVDYYPEASKERFGITLRFLFQSTEKTLTEAEVDVWMEKIKEVLMETAGVEIR